MTQPASHSPRDRSTDATLAGWPQAASALPDAERAVASVAGMLRLAHGMALAGRRVDLSGLERMIGPLCARSLDLPPAEGRQLALGLYGLVAEIDAVRAALAAPPD